MARQISPRLAALSAAAILAAFGAGYALTEPIAETMAPPVAVPHSHFTDPADLRYRDGAYSGTGTSAFGDVTVSVIVRQQRIAAVSITACTTSYSQRWIDGLPDEAVARQSAGVDVVSGATYSSTAFHDALRQALGQARL
jgi:uncharacterized protein with FMN-binding domain